MNLSDDVFGLLAKGLGQMHKTARKRQRDARRYARMCASGRKHRYGRPH